MSRRRGKGKKGKDREEPPMDKEAFQEQFAELDITPPKRGEKYLYIERERPANEADPRYGRTVEAITGATQTSMAVGRFLNANLEQFRRAMAAGPSKSHSATKN